MNTRHTVIDTATLGPVTIVATGEAVTGVYFRHHIRRPTQELFGLSVSFVDDTILGEAAGRAVGANPLCIFVPCHRVIGANWSLTGYASGLKRKRALLELEEPAAVAAGRSF
ncbi:methylated-DNA--[protein]-cysteine S-methyltransferase [Nocardia stercoris]|uniref:MGMT family protein n=1 Tax=Nocardia stercoris TaxID=2483361 RepID=A0A3M2KZE7_9NOCA|nr:MGMT family protein [Nocardia stercoris]RMI28925.1 MGMT family protein [Nocardia stercoris]